ncbi:hypothetical protein M622_17580 [Thauera terpenica 58Eu]|uniref:Short-chain dehydrogenase n=1 Tax=Thauera terpenica 58Eu TaxID=1348657 RepID=S9ZCD0_9RHOO|nr:SDR family oxidoreductase [Thauera terpenica]EPZ14950.1 hypothetical protein M622_17580 [Thauera terpenica 58Eu]
MHEIVVTGSSSGIGSAVTTALHAQGRTVLGVAHHGAEFIADLGTTEGRVRGLDETLQRSGGVLDGLVCAAGLGPTEDPARIVSVNYFGVLACLDALLPALRRGRNPAAVLLSSTGAVQVPDADSHPLARALADGDEERARAEATKAGQPMLAYCLSKYAVTCAMRERAATWAQAGVRINAVAPGPIETPMLAALQADERVPEAARMFLPPVGRYGRAEEVADCVTHLLSPSAAFIHGALLFIDGGIDALTRPHRF